MLNKVILIGRLGADPEVRFTQNGVAVANLSLATNRRWKGQDGQMVEESEWHRVVAFNRLAEICRDYLNKGSLIYIEGRLRTNKWQDQNGNDRYTTEIVANEMKMLGPKGAGSGGSGGGGYASSDMDSSGGFSSGGDYSASAPTGDDVPF